MTQRRTRQRAAILSTFQSHSGPLSAAEVLELAQAEAPGLGAATVYRAINSLLEDGAIAPVDLPGQATRYELAGKDHHHHFHCTGCGRAFDIEGCLGGLQSLVPRGFRVTGHDIVLHGLCPACAA